MTKEQLFLEQNINSVLLGDSTVLAKELPEGCIDMVLSDPPYGIKFQSQISENHDVILNDKFEEFTRDLSAWFATMRYLIKKNGIVAMFCAGGGKTPAAALATLEGMKHFNLINTLVWDKGCGGIGWKYKPQYETVLIFSKVSDGYCWYDNSHCITNVLKYNRYIPKSTDHPTQKPPALLKKLITLHTKPMDIVCDLFAGSGSTLVAAKELGRRFIGFELFQKYYDMASENIRRTTFVTQRNAKDLFTGKDTINTEELYEG
jgi:site-specific DNA-methyltransferase (adenine-specific)